MLKSVLAACALLCVLTINAEARQRHRPVYASDACNLSGSNAMPCEGVTTSVRGEMVVRGMHGFGSARKVYRPRSAVSSATRHAAIVAHPAGCPVRAFCGCGAAVRVFGRPVRELWLAANWFKFPRAQPASGMVAVRRHHVFVLEAHLGGNTWQVYDANSGGRATRIHARSIDGYVIVNPHASSIAFASRA